METERDRDTERPATSEKLLHRKKRAGIGGVLPAMCASARFPRGRAGLRLPRWSHPESCPIVSIPSSSTCPCASRHSRHQSQFTGYPATPSTFPLTTLFCTLSLCGHFPWESDKDTVAGPQISGQEKEGRRLEVEQGPNLTGHLNMLSCLDLKFREK